MTKVIILGEAQGAEPEKKNIEFVKVINFNGLIDAVIEPEEYNFIELISRNYDVGDKTYYDLMFAYDRNRNSGTLYLGKFNDGIV